MIFLPGNFAVRRTGVDVGELDIAPNHDYSGFSPISFSTAIITSVSPERGPFGRAHEQARM
jgi:hypothetical protein